MTKVKFMCVNESGKTKDLFLGDLSDRQIRLLDESGATKVIWLTGNRRLINATKKADLKTFNPESSHYNGWGYESYGLSVSLCTRSDVMKFNKVLKDVFAMPVKNKPQPLSDEEKKIKWAARLAKLTGIPLKDAEIIAEEKKNYKIDKINELTERQFYSHSSQRQKLINKLQRENPLRRIKNVDHAMAILSASNRHNNSNYEVLLEDAKALAAGGDIERDEVQSYARNNMQYFND